MRTAPAGARHLSISDIDDTIVPTGVANKPKMPWRLYFANGEGHRPFPGMDTLLRGLHAGGNGTARNPIFYLSRSPWGIYPLLQDFFNRHDPLRHGAVARLGISWHHTLPRRAADHKNRMIGNVMQALPGLPTVLIGDSGQHDPEVYADVVRRFLDRVCVVYIRNLSLSSQRSEELNDMRDLLAAESIDFVISSDTQGFVTHATEQSLMPPPPEPRTAPDVQTTP